MGKRWFIIALLLLPILSWSQAPTAPAKPTAGLAFGLLAHSYGFGFDVRYLVPKERNSLFLGLSLSSYKNPHELKIESAYADQGGKDYIYDKLNNGYIIAPTIGISRKLVSQDLFNRVGLYANVSVAPLIALLKPYYVEVAVPFNGNQALVEVHRYDPALYNYGNIYGAADYFLGMREMTAMPGGRAKLGTLLDFSSGSNYIRALELSLFADVFAKRLPLLGATPNKQFFIGGSVEILVGDIW